MASQLHTKLAAETLTIGVDFSTRLVDGDTLTGTPTATVSPSGPTLSGVQRNASAVTILSQSVPANQAVIVTVAGGTAGVTYTITVTAQTTSGQTMVERCTLRVDA